MSIAEALIALQERQICQYYSLGEGRVSWLAEGWHDGMITAVNTDKKYLCVWIKIQDGIIDITTKKDIDQLLRVVPQQK